MNHGNNLEANFMSLLCCFSAQGWLHRPSRRNPCYNKVSQTVLVEAEVWVVTSSHKQVLRFHPSLCSGHSKIDDSSFGFLTFTQTNGVQEVIFKNHVNDILSANQYVEINNPTMSHEIWGMPAPPSSLNEKVWITRINRQRSTLPFLAGSLTGQEETPSKEWSSVGTG